MLKTNYHCHTTRCFHAQGEDEAYVQAAVKGGFDVLGIADHGPWPFNDGYVSGMRLPMEDLQQYLDSVNGLKEKYAGQIELHVGFEQEYWPSYRNHPEWLLNNGVEYLILGQHILDSENLGGWTVHIAREDDGVLRYADSVCEAVRTGWYSYVAHPDLFMVNRTVDQFNTACERATEMICQACREQNIPLEYNLLGAGEKRAYPSEPFWELARKYWDHAILGVDAHSPAALLNDKLFAESREKLMKMGYTVLEKLPFKEV